MVDFGEGDDLRCRSLLGRTDFPYLCSDGSRTLCLLWPYIAFVCERAFRSLGNVRSYQTERLQTAGHRIVENPSV